jgi:hypothetical protein
MRRHLTRSLLALTGSLLAASAMSVRAQALLPGTVAGTRVVPESRAGSVRSRAA